MKTFQTIPEILEFTSHKHKFINSQHHGGYGVVLLRRKNGTRLMIQELKHFRMYKYKLLDENVLAIYNIVTGLGFKGKKIQSATSILYLNNLLQINVYDHSAHFVSDCMVDFAYVEDETSVNITTMQEFLHDEPGVIRAQWTSPDKDIDELLDMATFGRRVKIAEVRRRYIGMDCSEL